MSDSGLCVPCGGYVYAYECVGGSRGPLEEGDKEGHLAHFMFMLSVTSSLHTFLGEHRLLCDTPRHLCDHACDGTEDVVL